MLKLNFKLNLNILKIPILALCLLISVTSQAAIIWVGGEDFDFPIGSPVCFTTSGGLFRAGYARGAVCVYTCGNISSSVAFTAPVTSAWFSGRVWKNTAGTSVRWFGLGKYGTGNSLWVGSSTANHLKIALWKYDGTTWTQLATETGTSLAQAAMNKIDVELVSYGATATVNVYYNGLASAKITYTGDVTAGGATNLDDIRVSGCTSGFTETDVSELIVSTTDTRLMSAVTLAPTGAGTTNQWSGLFTDVNELSQNDTTLISSSVSGDKFQCQVTDLPVTNVAIESVRVAVRAAKAGSSIGGLSPGVFTNAAVSVPAATTLPGAFINLETYYSNNPVTSSPWTPTEINALQLNLQAAP